VIVTLPPAVNCTVMFFVRRLVLLRQLL
jgi:hypothetical protein